MSKKPKRSYDDAFVDQLMADHMTLEEQVECEMWVQYDLSQEEGWEGSPGRGYTWRDSGRFEVRVVETTVMMVDIQVHACTSSMIMIPEALQDWIPPKQEKMVKFHCPHPGLAIALARTLRMICEDVREVCPGSYPGYRRRSTKSLQEETARLRADYERYRDEDYE